MEKQTKKQSKTKQNNKENKQTKHFKQQGSPLPQNCRKIQKQNNELKT